MDWLTLNNKGNGSEELTINHSTRCLDVITSRLSLNLHQNSSFQRHTLLALNEERLTKRFRWTVVTNEREICLMISKFHSQENIVVSIINEINRDNENCKSNKQNWRLIIFFHYSRQFRSSLRIPPSSQRYRSPHLEVEVRDT